MHPQNAHNRTDPNQGLTSATPPKQFTFNSTPSAQDITPKRQWPSDGGWGARAHMSSGRPHGSDAQPPPPPPSLHPGPLAGRSGIPLWRPCPFSRGWPEQATRGCGPWPITIPRQPVRTAQGMPFPLPGLSLTQKKKKKKSRPEPGNFKRARGHSMCSTMVVAVGGWRLAAVGGWQLATGGWWRLVVVGGGWWLAVGGWRQLAVGNWRLVAAGGWRRLVAGGWWRLVVGGWWRLAVDGSWRLAVGGPLGLSLRAVLSKKKKKKISFLKDAPAPAQTQGCIRRRRRRGLKGGGKGRSAGTPPPPGVPLWSPRKARRKF